MTAPPLPSSRNIRLVSGERHRTSLLIDGKDISSKVTRLNLDIDPGEKGHCMRVDLAAFPVDVDMHSVRVLIDEETHDLLVWLGWTPPPEEANNAIH